MKHKLLLTALITTLFITSAAAQDSVFQAPGAEVSDDTLSVELEAHSSGWATLALPVNGAVPLSEITDDCQIQGDAAFGFNGGGTSTDAINGMRGYAVALEESCTAEIDISSVSGGLDTQLPDDEWVVFSVPREMSVSELETGCDFNGIDGTNMWEVTLEQGNVPLDSDATLQPTSLYWIRTSGSDCEVDLSNQPFQPPEGGDDSDSSDDSEETTAEAGDLYFWSTEGDGGSHVNNEAGSPNTDENMHYDMWDGRIEGRWTSHGSGERTIIVENTYGQVENTGSGSYVSVPAEGGETWGTEQDGVHHMTSYGDSEYTVRVEDAETGEVIQEDEFTFTPNSGDDGSSGGDEISLDSGSGTYQAREVPGNFGGGLSIDSASYSNGNIDVSGGIHTKGDFNVYTADDDAVVKLLVNGEEVDRESFCQRMTSTAYGSSLDRKFDFDLTGNADLSGDDSVSVEVDHRTVRVQLSSECGGGRETNEIGYSYDLN